MLTDGQIKSLNVTCDAQSISNDEKTEFKELLRKWDPSEYLPTPNHYFDIIDKTEDRLRFLELVGGSICRPYKFPFNDKSKTQAVSERMRIIYLESCESQLNELKKLLASEISR